MAFAKLELWAWWALNPYVLGVGSLFSFWFGPRERMELTQQNSKGCIVGF